MAQTFEKILADETAREAEQRATLAELKAREASLSEDERSIVETLEYQIRFNDEHGLDSIARDERQAQLDHEDARASTGEDEAPYLCPGCGAPIVDGDETCSSYNGTVHEACFDPDSDGLDHSDDEGDDDDDEEDPEEDV